MVKDRIKDERENNKQGTSVKVKISIPYSEEKNLGKAYNETMERLEADEWGCLCDSDTCFLTPDAGTILETYATKFPDAGILTCFTNRISPLSKEQLLGGVVSSDDRLTHHIRMAEKQKRYLYEVTKLERIISGFLMLVSKRTWDQIKFTEDLKCLGVDNDYSRRVMDSGREVLRMDGLFVWHTYRLLNGIKDKSHLK